MSHHEAGSSSAARPRFAVMGAGAVGCYFGGLLARAGHDVTLIARPDHVQAIERDGLRLQASTFDEHVRLGASSEAASVAGAKLVLFCVKSTDTESAASQMRASLAPDAVVLTLQNGVDNAERLRGLLAQQVLATVVYVGVEMAGAGHVRHHGRGELVIESASASESVARVLIAAGIPTEVSDNVQGALWAKLILNCAYNAISAIAQVTYGQISRDDRTKHLMHAVVAECLAVARASGVQVAGDMELAVAKIAQAMPAQYSSTAQDLARGKPSEIDHLNGKIVRQGEALGVPTPVNSALHTLVKLMEARGSGGPTATQRSASDMGDPDGKRPS